MKTYDHIPTLKELIKLMKEVSTERTVDEHSDTVVIVKHAGQEVYRWDDNANIDYPEDLNWTRTIGGVFDSGVAFGLYLSSHLPTEE